MSAWTYWAAMPADLGWQETFGTWRMLQWIDGDKTCILNNNRVLQ
jgi:hypothetical protein